MNDNTERRGALLWTVMTSTFCLRSHRDPFAFFTTLPRLSIQIISKKFYLILRKLHRTRKIFLKIILRPCTMNYWCKFLCIISNDISSTTWTNRTRNTLFWENYQVYTHIIYIYIYCRFNRPRRLLKGWHLFPFHSVHSTWFFDFGFYWSISITKNKCLLLPLLNELAALAQMAACLPVVQRVRGFPAG